MSGYTREGPAGYGRSRSPDGVRRTTARPPVGTPGGRRAVARPPGRTIEPQEGKGPSKSLLTKVLIVSVVLILLLVSVQVVSFLLDPDDDEGEPVMLDRFVDGSSTVLVNSTYVGEEAYILLPSGAKVEKASVKVSGGLPPQKRSYEAGRNPVYIAAGDIDRDLYVDGVVINNKDSTLMVMKNMGGGILKKTTTTPVGLGPIKVLLGDLNGDLFPDAMVMSEDSKDITVLFNDNIGGFRQKARPLEFVENPSDMALMDFDNDQDLDIVVTTLDDDSVNVLENDGNGMFVLRTKFQGEGNPNRVTPIDMDRDGRTDLIMSNRQDRDAQVYDSELGKMQRWFNTLSFYRNLGNGTFESMVGDVRVQKGVSDIAAGDLNGDGWLDLVMSNLGYANISIVLSDGEGDFRRDLPSGRDALEMVSPDPSEVNLTDVDNDGDLDLLALSRSADSILVYRGDGTGAFLPFEQYHVGANPSSFDLLDFDLDGDMDIITSDWKGWGTVTGENGTVSLLENLREGIFGVYRLFPTGTSPRGIFTGDVDSDGDVDVLSANYFGSTVSVLKNDGIGKLAKGKEYEIGLEPYAVVIGDFDGDGNMDGASADEANYRIVVLKSDGDGGFTTDRYLYDIGAWPYSLRAMDIDKDGDVDLYTSNYFQNSITILFNNGSGDFRTMFSDRRVVYLEGEMPYDSLMCDLNGDGVNDLVSVNRGDNIDPTDTLSVMINDGTFTFEDRVSYKVGGEPTSGVAFDMDNDGDLDLATANTKDDTISVLINSGSGTFQKIGDFLAGGRPQFVNAMDMDGDGWRDLVVTNTDTNNLVFLRNEGGLTLVRAMDLCIGSYPYAIDVDDLNGDGRVDLALTSVNTNTVVTLGCYHYPSDVAFDAGADNKLEMEQSGLLRPDDVSEVDIADGLNRYLQEHAGTDGWVRVPLRVIAGKEGVVVLSDLFVLYHSDD